VIYPISAETLPEILRLEAGRDVAESSLYWSDCWEPAFYVALAREGFISIALADQEHGELIVAELQEAYAVLDWGDFHVSRKLAKLLRSERLVELAPELRLGDSCERVLERLADYHGRDTWLIPSLLQLFLDLERTPPPGFRLHAVELWSGSEERLVAGELGYSIGRTYTSLSGFCRPEERRWRHFGTLQLHLLARALEERGYAFWNLGHPQLAYKHAIGAQVVPRTRFLQRWRAAVGDEPNRPLDGILSISPKESARSGA